jgi:paraquat-inducible protein A
MALLTQTVICRDCDTVHRTVALNRGDIACCVRCEGVLARYQRVDVTQALALTLAAAILLVVANVTPVLSIELDGIQTQANIWTAALSMERGWISCAALVLAATTLLVPTLQIGLLLWLLSFASAARRAPGLTTVLVVLHLLRPWSMTEVFLLGALVAMVKLSSWVSVVAGVGLWALAGLTIILAVLSKYESRSWWALDKVFES